MFFKNKKDKEIKEVKNNEEVVVNELNDDALFNISGGMEFPQEEAERNKEYIENIINLPKK